jgi:hypothetical protein
MKTGYVYILFNQRSGTKQIKGGSRKDKLALIEKSMNGPICMMR